MMRLHEAENLSPENQDRLYGAFAASYEKATGAAWSRDKFLSRARNWNFYGDETGYVAVRAQNSGMKKLVGVAGEPRGILKGLDELVAEGGPIWGAVSADIARMAKKRGMIVPHLMLGGPTLIKIIVKLIPASVFGGHEPEITNDGGLRIDYDDVGSATKFLIGNAAYFKAVMAMPDVQAMKDKIEAIPGFGFFKRMLESRP